MKRNTVLYTVAFILLLLLIFLLNKTYNEITTYSQRTDRNTTVQSYFQNLSAQITRAAVLNPDFIENQDSSSAIKIFFADEKAIIQQLRHLRWTVKDSISIRITEDLSTHINAELSWLLKSNVPDSIRYQNPSGHIAALKIIDSLISSGIERTNFLISYEKANLSKEIAQVRLWMIFFITLSGLLLVYTTIRFFKQLSKTITKEKELETVLNRIDDGVVSLDKQWRYTFINDAGLAVHPLGREKTLGKLIWEVHPPLRNTVFWEKFQEAMQTKKVVDIENYYAPMDRWFSVRAYPSFDGLTIFYRDVTEGKKAEQELLQTLKEVNDYKYALDESSIVAITDQRGIIKHANQNFCKISKYPAEELIGRDHRIINSGYHSTEFIKNLWTTIANGKIWKGELKNKAKDGTIYWVDTTIVPFLDEKGKPYQYVAIRFDITERKLAEEKIIDLNIDLEKKIKERTQQLKKSNEELEAFSYSVSHDLRAPLRGIVGFSAILEEDYRNVLDDEGKRITSVIKSNTIKMGQLIDDLLTFSRMGRRDIIKTTMDTRIMVEEVIEELGHKVNAGCIDWKIHSLPKVNGDISTIRQVWINLISNAIKYSGNTKKQCIEIGFQDQGRQFVFYVKDNGVGFDEKYKEKLFKVFQRLHSDEEFEGTGIGLALVEKIVSKHGGKVWAEGKTNEGTCFYFSLPA